MTLDGCLSMSVGCDYCVFSKSQAEGRETFQVMWMLVGITCMLEHLKGYCAALVVVFDLLCNLFRIALWPSVGKELSLWLYTHAFFCFFILMSSQFVECVGVHFPFGV